MTEPRTLVVVGSSSSHRPSDLDGWVVRTVATATQETIDVPDSVLFPLLERAQALAITSPRAARWLAAREIPSRLVRPVIVSGPATGAILPDRWVRLVPSHSGGAAVAELAHERDHRRLLHLRAEETAGTLERRAQALSLDLSSIPVYRTVCAKDLSPADRLTLDSASSFAFLAPSAVRNLFELDSFRFEFLSRRFPSVACGEATRLQLVESGWRDVRLAKGASTAEILSALEAP